MLKKSVPPRPTVLGSSLGRLWNLARPVIGSLFGIRATRFTVSGLEQGRRPSVVKAGERSTLSWANGSDRPSRFWDLRTRLANLLGRQSAAAEFDLHVPAGKGEVLEWLARQAEPELQLALLTEALALLDEFDRRVISLRLAGDPYESVAKVLAISPDTAGPRYALAVERLGERLAWVAALEQRGISPPERAALGQVRFLGRTAQEVARRLRLNEEVVERWIRLSDLPPRPEHGAPS